MKTTLSIIALTLIFINAEAQYKKASFLNKTGRIYDIGVTYRLQNGERSSAPGFFLSYGKESSEKRIHHWFDTEIILGHKYSYSTTEQGTSNKVQVNGKSGVDIGFRYNLAYFLADNSKDENKLLPFINIGLGYLGRSVVSINYDYTTVPANANPDKYPNLGTASFTYGGGGGILYRVNTKFGIRLSAAYYGVTSSVKGNSSFLILTNHPTLSLAVRFRMDRDE